MCNCISEIKDKFLKDQPLKDKIIDKVTFVDEGLIMGTGNKLTTDLQIRVEFQIRHRKSPFRTSITGSFCPFCGEREEAANV